MPARSIIPYYGGKARMAPMIADLLDYSCSTYVEPFGGGARTLLNKPRHQVEIYNDYGEGVCALMRIMSDRETADEFIHTLSAATEYSEEEFLKQKAIYDLCNDEPEDHARKELIQSLIRNGFTKRESKLLTSFDSLSEKEKEAFDLKFHAFQESSPSEFKKFSALYKNWKQLKEILDSGKPLPRHRDLYESDISDMELAIATYVTFTMSRDGMGKVFSPFRFRDDKAYKNHITKLYESMERMEGVIVTQIDAMQFFREYALGKAEPQSKQMTTWINDPDVMMYCDPSYIRPEEDAKVWEKIDWAKVEETELVTASLDPQNLGKLYSMSFEYQDHEFFLKAVCEARCKLLISNYDLQLYNYYLTPERGWRRQEFQTVTTVGAKAENRRTEVLWYNY